jgi:hypothetical protein
MLKNNIPGIMPINTVKHRNIKVRYWFLRYVTLTRNFKIFTFLACRNCRVKEQLNSENTEQTYNISLYDIAVFYYTSQLAVTIASHKTASTLLEKRTTISSGRVQEGV